MTPSPPPKNHKHYSTFPLDKSVPQMVHLSMKRINAYFFKLDSGNEPVREWLMGLPKEDKKIIGADIKLVEYGWPIGMPVCKPLGGGLYEVRSNIS